MSENCPNCGAYIAPYNVITKQTHTDKNPVVILQEFHCKELLDDDSVCDTEFEMDRFSYVILCNKKLIIED